MMFYVVPFIPLHSSKELAAINSHTLLRKLVLPSSAGAACVGDTVVGTVLFNLGVVGGRRAVVGMLGIRASHFACVPRTPPPPLIIR